MIIIREVFTARPGQASKLAKLFKKAFEHDPNLRVMNRSGRMLQHSRSGDPGK
jgi:hypothetical protein